MGLFGYWVRHVEWGRPKNMVMCTKSSPWWSDQRSKLVFATRIFLSLFPPLSPFMIIQFPGITFCWWHHIMFLLFVFKVLLLSVLIPDDMVADPHAYLVTGSYFLWTIIDTFETLRSCLFSNHFHNRKGYLMLIIENSPLVFIFNHLLHKSYIL